MSFKIMPGQVNKKITWKTALISWILVFALKMLFAYGYCQLIFSQKPERKIGVISYASGDYGSYIGAMENYYQKKGYFFINQLGDTVRMGRQPYFAFPYWLARHFTDSKKASDFLTLVN